MSKRVLKWSIAVDDSVGVVGGGKVVHVASQNPPYLIEVWTEEFGVEVPRRVQVFGTGHAIPNGSIHLGSCIAGPFVWHVYEVTA